MYCRRELISSSKEASDNLIHDIILIPLTDKTSSLIVGLQLVGIHNKDDGDREHFYIINMYDSEHSQIQEYESAIMNFQIEMFYN